MAVWARFLKCGHQLNHSTLPPIHPCTCTLSTFLHILSLKQATHHTHFTLPPSLRFKPP